VYQILTELSPNALTSLFAYPQPSISYLYFKRTEKYRTTNSDAIIGGVGGDGEYHKGATVALDTQFTSVVIGGFGISPNMWGILRIIPQNYEEDTKTNRQVYPVELWYNRVEFTLLQLTANIAGFVSILSALYLLLIGTRRWSLRVAFSDM
jgi:hypothetical protein